MRLMILELVAKYAFSGINILTRSVLVLNLSVRLFLPKNGNALG